MEKDSPCEELLEKTCGEVLANEVLRKQLMNCLETTIFRFDGFRIFYENDTIFIEFTESFFDKPDFLWHGKPSDTKLDKFYETLKTLSRESGRSFIVDSSAKPTSTNLQLKLKFRLTEFLKERRKETDVTVADLLRHLKDLWQELRNQLTLNYKWNVF